MRLLAWKGRGVHRLVASARHQAELLSLVGISWELFLRHRFALWWVYQTLWHAGGMKFDWKFQELTWILAMLGFQLSGDIQVSILIFVLGLKKNIFFPFSPFWLRSAICN